MPDGQLPIRLGGLTSESDSEGPERLGSVEASALEFERAEEGSTFVENVERRAHRVETLLRSSDQQGASSCRFERQQPTRCARRLEGQSEIQQPACAHIIGQIRCGCEQHPQPVIDPARCLQSLGQSVNFMRRRRVDVREKDQRVGDRRPSARTLLDEETTRELRGLERCGAVSVTKANVGREHGDLRCLSKVRCRQHSGEGLICREARFCEEPCV
ncbi:MAG: hypothetical protein AAGF91_04865 [Actinomycetota bacterium]